MKTLSPFLLLALLACALPSHAKSLPEKENLKAGAAERKPSSEWTFKDKVGNCSTWTKEVWSLAGKVNKYRFVCDLTGRPQPSRESCLHSCR